MKVADNLLVYTLTILAICFGLAFLFATCYVVLMPWNVSPTDGAYGRLPLGDPLVFLVMSMIASIAALVVFPFTFFAFRNRKLQPAVCILVVIVLAEILIVTPINVGLGFYGSFVAYGIGLCLAYQFAPVEE